MGGQGSRSTGREPVAAVGPNDDVACGAGRRDLSKAGMTPTASVVFGLTRHATYLPPIGSFGDIHALVDLAVGAEQAGWDGFFLWNHIQYECPIPLSDAWVALSAPGPQILRIGIATAPDATSIAADRSRIITAARRTSAPERHLVARASEPSQ
jgi:hypothetical protein